MKKLLLFFYALLCITALQAQNRQIRGRISADNGEALSGATVRIKGSQQAASTNANGEYSLAVPAGKVVLVVSYVGYKEQEIAVENQADISLQLHSSGSAMNEVVVVGYGTQTKKAVTGSVASVNYETFKDRSFSNVTQALAGQVAGVNITQAQGAPGSLPIIRIRGISSITAGTNPLMVVDGVPLEDFNLNMINPQDIESVEVLKDASSAAIYGSRGANGVIIVTTKLGKIGKSTVSATYEYGTQKVVRTIGMMDAQQWIQYYIDAHNNAWVDLGGGRKASDPNSARPANYKIPEDFIANPGLFGKGTDWQDVMFRVAPSQNAQVSVSGGTDKTRFLFSAAYLNQDAVLDRNYYHRLTLRSNIRHKVSDAVTVGMNLGITGVYDRTDGTQGKSDVVSLALQSDPIFPVYNENGNLGYRDPNSTWYRFISYGDLNLWHPYSLTRFIDKKNKTFNTLGTGFLEYSFLQNFQFRSSVSANLSNNKNDSYRYKNQGYGYSSLLNSAAFTNSAFSLNWLTENTLTYDKRFGSHAINILAGYTAQKQQDETSGASAAGFPNDLVQTLNAGTSYSGVTSFSTEWSMLSYLARLNYNYSGKYYLSAAIRRDGSSRFGADRRWGYFPSLSVGWVASDERFLKGVGFINFLKVRASYGQSGNNQIPNYGSVSLLGASNANYASGSTLLNGQSITTISNDLLRWEKTDQVNLGFDARLFNNRVNLSLDIYNSRTKDMLLNVPVPDITGFSTQLTNIGKMQNRGIDLTLSTKNVVGQFNWTSDINFSLNRNKVLQLGPGNAPIMYTDYLVNVRTEVGQPISNFYGYVFDGVFKNQAAIDKAPHDASTRPGDPVVRDVNGDGKITEADRTILGNYQPDFMAGLTNTFSYKGLELSVFLQGSFGGEIVNQNVRYLGWWNNGRNMYAGVANRWRSETEPGDGTHFRATLANTGLQSQFSSYWVEDASFVRVKNIRISYSLPVRWTSRTPFKNPRVYINAENVHLFSKYLGYDPENTTYNATSYSAGNTGLAPSGIQAPSGAFVGVDYGSYPVPRIITFGIKTDL
ncbi:MAG: TonB-dependent receptor [Williamsia sp.]|nr:TonB-dependent receptor [Williamsia sp.]